MFYSIILYICKRHPTIRPPHSDARRWWVLRQFVVNPHQSVDVVSIDIGIYKTSVHRVIKQKNQKQKPHTKKKNNHHKVQLHQEIKDDETGKRLQFCGELLQQIDSNIHFTSRIFFIDEVTFSLHETVNCHKCRYWWDENWHWM